MTAQRSILYPAVRAFNHAIQPYALAAAIGSDADRQFDGGEWSDAQHADAWERTQRQVALRVGRRFNLAPSELLDMAELAINVEHDHFMKNVR
jgi:hypothetical protein